MRQSRSFRSMQVAPYVFVLPFIISFLVFYLYPITATIIMSFQEVVPGQTHFIGVANYNRMISEEFFKALKNSFIYTALTILILIPGPIILAAALNSRRSRLNAVY